MKKSYIGITLLFSVIAGGVNITNAYVEGESESKLNIVSTNPDVDSSNIIIIRGEEDMIKYIESKNSTNSGSVENCTFLKQIDIISNEKIGKLCDITKGNTKVQEYINLHEKNILLMDSKYYKGLKKLFSKLSKEKGIVKSHKIIDVLTNYSQKKRIIPKQDRILINGFISFSKLKLIEYNEYKIQELESLLK